MASQERQNKFRVAAMARVQVLRVFVQGFFENQELVNLS